MPLYNPPVLIQDNGTTEGAVNTLNFTGSTTAIVSGNVATINVTGGSASVTQVEIDFGTIPTRYKTFTITNPFITALSNLIITQSGAAATGRSADENEMDPIIFSGNPTSGAFTLNAAALNGPVVGKYRVNYIVS